MRQFLLPFIEFLFQHNEIRSHDSLSGLAVNACAVELNITFMSFSIVSHLFLMTFDLKPTFVITVLLRLRCTQIEERVENSIALRIWRNDENHIHVGFQWIPEIALIFVSVGCLTIVPFTNVVSENSKIRRIWLFK
jgi:hypothetical protein